MKKKSVIKGHATRGDLNYFYSDHCQLFLAEDDSGRVWLSNKRPYWNGGIVYKDGTTRVEVPSSFFPMFGMNEYFRILEIDICVP